MILVVNFRPPDPYVELDGVRKPLSDYPNLKITRLDGEEIPKLREVNMLTNRIKRAVVTPGLVIEKEEECTYLRIKGLYDLDCVITGHDMYYGREKDRPKPPSAAPAGVDPPQGDPHATS
jgi:hypothetical protein